MARQALGSGFGGRKRGLDSIISPTAKSRNKAKTEANNVTEKEESKKNITVKAAAKKTDDVDTKKTSVKTAAGKRTARAADAAETKKTTSAAAAKTKTTASRRTAKTADATEPTAQPVENVEAPYAQGGEVLLPIIDIEPNREQPRKVFDEETLRELAESIRQYGVLSPILVQKNGDYYEIIAGERRWRAAKMAGLKEVPVIVREYTRQEVVEISLIENIQREDLNPIEEARAYRRLLTEFELTQDAVATRVSKSRAAITNSTRLLRLDPRVQDMLIDGSLTAGHARALLSIADADTQNKLAQQVVEERLSVREVERLVRDWSSGTKKRTPKKNAADPLGFLYTDMENRLTEALGTKVAIRRGSGKRGKIEISYHSDEELERLTAQIFAPRRR